MTSLSGVFSGEVSVICFRFIALVTLSFLGICACGSSSDKNPVGSPDPDAAWRIYALEYGKSERFRRSVLVRGEPKDERVPLSWMVWLISSTKGDRKILVDTGFDDDKLEKSWRFVAHRPVPELLEDLGVKPEEITDVVITHSHWDHMGNMGPYAEAKFWIQKTEYEYAKKTVSDEKPVRHGVRLRDVEQLDRYKEAGRVVFVDGEGLVDEGVKLHLGGKHTGGIQWIEVTTSDPSRTGKKIVLATDVAYLYENIEKIVPSGSTLDGEQDRRTIERMRNVSKEKRLIIPGHDPLVMKRFKRVNPSIVEIL